MRLKNWRRMVGSTKLLLQQGREQRFAEVSYITLKLIYPTIFTSNSILLQKSTKAGTKKAGSSSSEETTERLQAARDKRQAQRNRLKEMKMAAKRAREQEAELAAAEPPATGGENTMECHEEPLPITPSPKKSKLGK